jgi:hypothetical protein
MSLAMDADEADGLSFDFDAMVFYQNERQTIGFQIVIYCGISDDITSKY